MRYVSRLATLAAAACLAGCASGGSRSPTAVTRTASTSAVAVAPTRSPPPAVRAPGASDGDSERRARQSQLSTARAVARTFFPTYLAYLSGRSPAKRVADVSPALRSQLGSGRAETTPAELASDPRIGHVYVVLAGPPLSVTAVAFVEAVPGQQSRITATLEPAGRTWRVVAVGG